jgi:hypothetical protein
MHNAIYNFIRVIFCVTDIKTIKITLVHKKMETLKLQKHLNTIKAAGTQGARELRNSNLSNRYLPSRMRVLRSVKGSARLDKVRRGDVGRSYQRPE